MNTNGRKHLYCLLGCLGVCVFIFIIRHAFSYPGAVVEVSHGIFDAFTGVIEAYNLTDVFEVLISIPPTFVVGFFGLIAMLIGGVILLAFNRTVRYSHKLLQYRLVDIIKRGILIYCGILIIIGVFSYSIIGIPIATVVFVMATVITLYGMVPVAIGIGDSIQEILRGNDRRIAYNYVIGMMFILVCMNVYAVGIAFLLFVFPVCATGTAFYTIEMKFFRRCIDDNKFDDKKDLFDKRKIRDLITKGM